MGLPRPFLRGVVDRRWHEPTRSAARGHGNRICAWQVREQPQFFGHEPQPDAHTALVLAITHHPRGLYFAWPGCLQCISFLCARTLHLPARTLPSFVCLPACLCWRIPRARACMWCLRGPPVHECPALVCACLPCACPCALSCTYSTYPMAVSSPTRSSG